MTSTLFNEQYYPTDIDMNIMLQMPIEDIQQLCHVNNQYVTSLCENKQFWNLKFEQGDLPLPTFNPLNATQWIETYKVTHRMVMYLKRVMDVFYTDGIEIPMTDPNIIDILFLNVASRSTLHIMWQKMSVPYFKR